MKHAILYICMMLLGFAVPAQEKWCVSLNGIQKLKNVSENREENRIEIDAGVLSKPGQLEIKFNRYDTAMKRSIMVDDATGGIQSLQEIKKIFRIKTAALAKLFENRKELSIYYTEIPRDINKAMAIRVRPVHVCTLILLSK